MIKNLFRLSALLTLALSLSACLAFFSENSEPNTPPPIATQHEAITNTPTTTPMATVTGNAEQKPASQYLQADRSPPRYAAAKQKCIDANGQHICGYDCKTSNGITKCADDPKKRCMIGGNGAIACGYDCKKTDNGVGCGKYLYSNCVTNDQGEVRCGNNCYKRDDGELICGK